MIKNVLIKNLLEMKIIKLEEKGVYEYGIKLLLTSLFNAFWIMCIAIILQRPMLGIIYILILATVRTQIGGYHAKTRVGCYVFSCMFVYILCMLNKIIWRHEVGIMGMILAEILIFHFAPVENENRMLELQEKMLFRKQAIQLLITVNVIISIIFLIHKYLFLAYWLEKGVIFTGILLVLGLKR